MNFDPLVFEFDTLIEIPVTIGKRRFLLREADGETGVAYVNRQMQQMKVTDGKVSGLADVASLGPFLLSRCLVELELDADGVPTGKTFAVSEQAIRSWKNTIVQKLVDRCKQISDIDQADDSQRKEALGNEQSGLTDGSA